MARDLLKGHGRGEGARNVPLTYEKLCGTSRAGQNRPLSPSTALDMVQANDAALDVGGKDFYIDCCREGVVDFETRTGEQEVPRARKGKNKQQRKENNITRVFGCGGRGRKR